MNEWIIDIIRQGGYTGIFLLMVIENVIPPIPSEVIMGFAGIAVAHGQMQFWPLLAIGTAGSVAGNWFWYLVGDRLGYRRLHPLVDRWGRWLGTNWDEVEKANAFFRSHGQWIVFALRFSPVLRTAVSLPAGLSHMPQWRFFLFTAAGAAIWNAALIMAGSLLARYLAEAGDIVGWVLIGSLVLAVAIWLWRVITWKPAD